MYRIRSATGTEAVYNSLEEFHAAVRNGQVAPEDEIFHTRANRWLDVKSHPHYRSVIGWLGQGDVATVLPPALTPVRGVSSPPPAPRPAEPGPRAPERVEAARPAAQQTVMRPQLMADGAAPKAVAQAPAPAGPPRKSKELAFIDTGDAQSGTRNHAKVMEAPKPPVATAPKPAAKPAPVAPHGTELQFLVMDDGIESPVRSSSGHRTVPEDLDLLFDSPKPATSRPAAASAPVAAPPKAPLPKPEVVAVPAPKVEAPKIEPPKAVAPKIEARNVEAPIVEAPKAVAATVEAPKIEPPKVEAPKVEVARIEAPKVEAPSPAPAMDLDIPEPAILTEPHLATAAHPVPRGAGSLRKGLLVGTGAFIVLLGVAIAAWKPWASATATAGLAAPSAGAPANDATTPAPRAAVSASDAAPLAPGGTRSAAFGAPAGLNRASDPVVPPKVDSAEPDEEIIAARPTFRPSLDVNMAGLSVGTDIPAAGGGAAAVPPSELARRLTQAEQQAQQELVARLGGFRALLAPDRIGTADGAARARAVWTAGGDAIRQYRSRTARLSRAYEDSLLSSQRSQRWPADEMRAWGSRQSLSETAETAQLADLMISQVTEGLELLAALDGKYQIKGGRIVFDNSGSIPRYLSIRTWVEQRMGVWQATPENARPFTLNVILRALGEGFPAAQ